LLVVDRDTSYTSTLLVAMGFNQHVRRKTEMSG
jgi:hypothetical protein